MDYQQIRDSNIARNENWLEANGLLNRAKQITVSSRKRRVREHSEPIRRSHRVELANSITPDFEEVSDLYSIVLSGGMICNACHNLVQSKSNNRNLSWRSHQSKCAQTNNKTTNLLRLSNSENIRDDLEFDHSGVMVTRKTEMNYLPDLEMNPMEVVLNINAGLASCTTIIVQKFHIMFEEDAEQLGSSTR